MKTTLLLALTGILLFGAEYGRITGKIQDNETGDPMFGANVVLEGTILGATTDDQGIFVINYVPAGTYTVTATYLGYDPYSYTNVIVNSDQTTPMSFKLRTTVTEIKGVVIRAEVEPIVISQTQTSNSITASTISRLPAVNLNQVLTFQTGVVQSNLGTHIRGGRNEEITYVVDGMVSKVPQSGILPARVNTSAVEEMSVISGGFDAEYGDALSGIINIVTREGGPRVSGRVNYLTDNVFPVDKWNYGFNLCELSFGGPLPLAGRMRYFLSGELLSTDAAEPLYYQRPSSRLDYKAQARLSYNFASARTKLTISGFSSREQFMRWFPQALKYFDNNPMDRRKNWIGTATLNYMPNAQTMATLKLGMTHYDRVFGNRDRAWEEANGRSWFDDYRMKAEHLTEAIERGVTPRYVVIDSVMKYHDEYTNRDVAALRNNSYGVENLFYTAGDFRNWAWWSNDDIQARFDVSRTVGKIHEFKTGIDVIRYDMLYTYNNLPWVTNPFWDFYHRQPFKIAAYVQDKMDFEGLIARLGLRFDYFDPKSMTWEHPNVFEDSTMLQAASNFKISPRVGISLPVTDRMKFRFNYGHYFQVPRLNDMYGNTDTSVVRLALTRGNTSIGNVTLKSQKTVMYEFGMENQLNDLVVFGLTSYFKDIYDLAQIRLVPALPMSYFQYFNVDYGNVKGFEVSLRKLMSGWWSASVNYTLQFAKGTASYAGEFYVDFYNSATDPITGLPLQPPQIDYWLDFDERSAINAEFSLDLPADFVFIPLQNFSGTAVFSYHSGHPYTPLDLRGNRLGDDNSARMPGYWNVDLSAGRRVALGPVNASVNLMVSNLFNSTQIVNVYQTTGKPDDHGDIEPTLGQFGNLPINSTRYSPQADPNHDGLITPPEMKTAYIAAQRDYYDDPTYYNEPFRIQVGLSLGF